MALSTEETNTVKAAVALIKRELEAAKTAGETGTLAVYKFGTFKVSQAAARKGRNPQTGGTIDIPARTVVRFSASKAWTGNL